MAMDHPLKTTTDLAVLGTATTINVAHLNEWITLTAGLLAIVWSAIRIGEWLYAKPWTKQRIR